MHQWRNIVSFLNVNHSVHPSEPSSPSHSEFLQISSGIRLRVIHIKTKGSDSKELKELQINNDRKSQISLYEDYWFTRCNKPSKFQRCSCSFRRSQRFSAISVNKDNKIDLNDDSLTIIQNKCKGQRSVELFVEKIIDNCLIEAFKEYVSKTGKSPSSKGIHNLGFENGEDCVDLGIKLKSEQRNVYKDLSKNCDLSYEKNDKNCKKYVNDDKTFVKSSMRKKKCEHSSPVNFPLVILLHGIGTSADIWWSVINSLSSQGHEIVAPDMLGHGYSSVPNQASAYKFKNLVKQAVVVFEHYVPSDDSRKIIIIAHSLGCSIATALCRYKSQQVSQLILISGGGPTPLAPPVQNEIPLITCLQTVFKPLLFCGVKRTLFYSSRGKYFECWEQNRSVVPPHVLHYIQKGQHWPEGDAAFHRKIIVPTLLVYGLQDKQVSLVQECEMERTIPKSFLELIPNCGHLPMLETPEQLNHMIICFINWWTK